MRVRVREGILGIWRVKEVVHERVLTARMMMMMMLLLLMIRRRRKWRMRRRRLSLRGGDGVGELVSEMFGGGGGGEGRGMRRAN